MKKKLAFSLLLVLVIAISVAVGAYAATDIKLFVNGKQSATDIQIIDGNSYVPLRAVAEMLGADVKWDGDARTITIAGKDYNPNPPAPSAAASFNANVNITSGPMTLNISKVTLDPAYQQDQYSSKIKAVVMDVTATNTSNDKVDWFVEQGKLVLNTKEQIDSGILYSDRVGGEFLGKVVKKGKLVFQVKDSNLSDITSMNLTIKGASDANYQTIGDDKTTDIILK